MAPRHETVPDRVRARDPGPSGTMNVRSQLADPPEAKASEPTLRLRRRDETQRPAQ
jgi:hypothetical protein